MADQHDRSADDVVRARRDFLKKCGKYAVVVPPSMTLLLARPASAGFPVAGQGGVLTAYTATAFSGGVNPGGQQVGFFTFVHGPQ